MGKDISLEEILDSEIVLVDGSITSHRGNILTDSYHNRYFNELDSSAIEREEEDVNVAISFMRQNNNIRTIEEVAEEVNEYQKKLGKKLKGMDLVMKEGEKNKKMLEELQEMAYQLKLDFERSRIRTDESISFNFPRYEIISEMVSILNGEIGLTKDTGYKYNLYKEKEEKTDPTDEKLASMFMQLNIEGYDTSLVTGDTDFVNLLGVIPGLIGSPDLEPNNSIFREKFTKKPTKIYIWDSKDGEEGKIIESDYSDFELRNTSYERTRKVKNKIRDLWSRYLHAGLKKAR